MSASSPSFNVSPPFNFSNDAHAPVKQTTLAVKSPIPINSVFSSSRLPPPINVRTHSVSLLQCVNSQSAASPITNSSGRVEDCNFVQDEQVLDSGIDGGGGSNGYSGGSGGGGGGGGDEGDSEEEEFGRIMRFEEVMKEAESRGVKLPSDMLEAAKTTGIREMFVLRYLELQVYICEILLIGFIF